MEKLVPLTASWHHTYKNSAYIYVGGLSYRLNEGDIVTIFSQFGEIVDCRLLKDRDTGDSKGVAFLAYEDQRSTVLAIDNFNGQDICGRMICVDHVKEYKIPKEYWNSSEEGEEDSDKISRNSAKSGQNDQIKDKNRKNS